MRCRSAFLYSDKYILYDFGPKHPFKPYRWRLTLNILKKLEAFNKDNVDLIEVEDFDENILRLVHDSKYIEFVKNMCKRGYGYLDYGDTPARRGVFEGALARVWGSVKAVELLAKGEYNHVFNFGGGLHHAGPNYASGFCVFNDIAIAIRYLQKKYKYRRIAVMDIDGHHGDGTQKIFYREKILTISIHRYDGFFFPGTGNWDEIGEDEGEGYSINIPLPMGVGDDLYIRIFADTIFPILKKYLPQVIVMQFGVDGYIGDPLVGLRLTSNTYKYIACKIHDLAHELCNGKVLITGGGGYLPEITARIWALIFLIFSGSDESTIDIKDNFTYTDIDVKSRILKILDNLRIKILSLL